MRVVKISLNDCLLIFCSYVITNVEGTELTLLPRLEEDEKEAVVEVVRPPSAETLALVERVFQKASSEVASEKATTTRDQLATAEESQGPHSTNSYLAQNCSYRVPIHGTLWDFTKDSFIN